MMTEKKQKTQLATQTEIESEDIFDCDNSVLQYMVEPDATVDLDY